jgi:shikimate dehydrogenase
MVGASEAPTGLTIIGDPVASSLSPVFQQAALDALGIAVKYGRTRAVTSEVPDVLEWIRRERMGANVTMPHKALVASLVDVLTPRAARAGAVNTVWVEGTALVGHNTDVDGIVSTVQHLFPQGVCGSVLVLGAGGSAAAILLALEHLGVRDTVLLARRRAQAEALIDRVGGTASAATLPQDVKDWSRTCDALSVAPALVINATPIGMADAQMPVPLDVLAERQIACFDLVYRPEETAWVRSARAKGLLAEDGLRMLIGQGAAAFTCWFNQPAPVDVMWNAVGRR